MKPTNQKIIPDYSGIALDRKRDMPDTTCVRQTQHTTPTTPNQGSETMPKVMNHSEYMKKTRTMDESSLRHVIKECKEVIELQSSFNENVGYYMDEIHYCCMELNRREKLGK